MLKIPESDISTSVNEAITIGMRETGTPINYLILAVLMMIGGLIAKIRK